VGHICPAGHESIYYYYFVVVVVVVVVVVEDASTDLSKELELFHL